MMVEKASNRPGDRTQRAVEGGHWNRSARGASPDVEPPSLERRAVRRRRQLTVCLLRRDPRLAVELASRR